MTKKLCVPDVRSDQRSAQMVSIILPKLEKLSLWIRFFLSEDKESGSQHGYASGGTRVLFVLWKQHTAPRASITCHTRIFFWSCARGSRCLRIVVFLASRKRHSISSMFLRTSTSFPTLALGSSTAPSLLYPSMSPSTATLQRGLCFGRLAEQSLLNTV